MPGVQGMGHRQRIAAAATASEGVIRSSRLASELLGLWAWGQISTPVLHRIASAAIDDGCNLPDLRRLSAQSHPNRSVMDQALPATWATKALSEQMLVLKNSPRSVKPCNVVMMLPHELFAALWEWDRNFFVHKLCGGPEGRIAEFWNQMEGHPALQADSPIAARSNYRTRCIPLALHGDGVACTGISKSWSKSADVLSWRSLLSKGHIKHDQFLCFVLAWSLMVAAGDTATWPMFLKKFSWSLYWLFVGKWPRRDYLGNPYPPDSREGDTKHKSKI